MNILLVGDYPADPRLGSPKVLYKLHECFLALGHRSHMLLAEDIGGNPGGPRVRQLVGPMLAARAIKRAQAEFGPFDVVDVASAEGLVFALKARLNNRRRPAIIARSNGLEHLNYRRMLEDHDHGIRSKSWVRRIWFPTVRLSQVAAAARLADRMIVLNVADREFAALARWKEPDAIEIIPHGVSEQYLAAAPDYSAPRGAGLLFCGSWTETKGTDYLVAAFESVAERFEGVRLTILGGGVSDGIILDRFSEAVRHRVRVVPRMEEADVMEAYRRHDVLVVSSTYEGFGMVVIEAMTQGLPVVATRVGCAPQYIEDGVTGRSVATRDSTQLADAIAWMLEDDSRRQPIARAARDRVEKMSWTATARRTIACYEEAICKV